VTILGPSHDWREDTVGYTEHPVKCRGGFALAVYRVGFCLPVFAVRPACRPLWSSRCDYRQRFLAKSSLRISPSALRATHSLMASSEEGSIRRLSVMTWVNTQRGSTLSQYGPALRQPQQEFRPGLGAARSGGRHGLLRACF
jgi:hypothetical protein